MLRSRALALHSSPPAPRCMHAQGNLKLGFREFPRLSCLCVASLHFYFALTGACAFLECAAISQQHWKVNVAC